MTITNRTGSDSRCCQPENAPYEWEDCVDYNHPAVKEVGRILGSLPPDALNHELGRIEQLVDEAKNGLLSDSGDYATKIKPIRRNPDLYELRLKLLEGMEMEDLDNYVLLRIYTADPPDRPKVIQQLHMHDKHGKPAGDQDIQISQALLVYKAVSSTRHQ